MFFITCFEKIDINEFGFIDVGASRVFGYFDTLERSEIALNRNECDMHETCYNYAMIEKIDFGIHPISEKIQFYKYDDKKNGYYSIQEPKEFVHYTNFALG